MKRVALIIARDKQGRILLQHKSKDAPNNPDMWCLFGGAIEQGELPEEAAVREFFEELQIKIGSPPLFTKTSDPEIERYYFLVQLDVEVVSLKKQLREGDNVGYFSIKEMQGIPINQAHHKTLIKFFHE